MPRGASSGPKAGGSAAQRQLKRQRAQQAHAKVHPEGEDEANEPLKEPPTSWHHVVRMRVLDASTSQRTKFLWFSSGQLLVLIQWVVMLSFSSALSIRRCMSSSDCNPASYCAGLSTAPTMIDPLNASAVIHRGYCLGCSSRYPDELHVPALLDVICAPATNSESCLSDCMTTCTGNPGDRYITAPAKTRVHASAFTAAEHACSEQCASSCKSALSQPGKAAAALSSAEIAGEPLFSTWLSIVDQCRSCDASVREGVRFATPAEAENLQVLKMSGLDFVALGLASLIVALTMTREVRDINIGAMMTMQAIERQRNAKKDDEDAETTTSGATEGGPSFVRQNDEEASTAVPAEEEEKGGENILSDTLASGVDLGKDVLEEGKKMITKNTRMLISEFMMPTRLSSLGGDDEYWIGEDIYTHIWRYVLGIQVVIRRYIIIPEVASTVVLLVTRCERLPLVPTIAKAPRPAPIAPVTHPGYHTCSRPHAPTRADGGDSVSIMLCVNLQPMPPCPFRALIHHVSVSV